MCLNHNHEIVQKFRKLIFFTNFIDLFHKFDFKMFYSYSFIWKSNESFWQQKKKTIFFPNRNVVYVPSVDIDQLKLIEFIDYFVL